LVAVVSVVCALAWCVVATSPAGAAAPSAVPVSLQEAGSNAAVAGELSTAQARALSRGYLVPDEAAYAAAKADAASRAAALGGGATPAPRSPAFDGAPLRSWQGIDDPGNSPTDSTSAIGTGRFIEVVNSEIAIYDRTNNAPLSVGTLAALTGDSGHLFDPQMLWDPGTNRFYYVSDNVVSSTDNRLEVGFSTTSTPSSTADFCKYTISTGAEFYDFPKLGDISTLTMIGANVFNTSGTFVRADVFGLTKPPSGSSCPAPTALTLSLQKSLAHANASPAFTPVPVRQTDTSPTGWIVSAGFAGTASSNFLSVFQVTMSATNLIVVGAAKTASVASYMTPAPAVQKGSTNTLDTADTRLTNAVSAIDPAHGSAIGIWTQHTVFGGPGAEIRWYEINPTPATPAPFQNGTAGSSSLFAFNGAISPDRRVNGVSASFGSSMVLGFNTSSSTQFLNIVAVSKRGNHGQSPQELILAGAAPQNDFTCAGGLCRSGDYAGASPDPASDTTKSDGVVWLTNQFPGNDWHTWNFAGRPSPSPK
jgi:hypothetical protein